MTLKEYLDNHKISSLIDAARFFNLSGKNPSTNIMRYIRGTRIPNKEIMKVINEVQRLTVFTKLV